MRLIALSFPGGQSVDNPAGFGTGAGQFTDIGSAVSSFLNLGMIVASILLVSWFSWGVFQYIFAGGDKNKLASARKRIIYALFGFFLIAIAFLIKDYVVEIFPNNTTYIQPLSNP